MATSDNTRYLFLLRHALAMPPGSGAQDSARALSPKGLEDAEALGKIMTTKGYVPDFILCSTALRTRQTLEQLLQNLKTDASPHYVSALYDGGTESYHKAAEALKLQAQKVLLVGHNPCIYEFAAALAGKGREQLLQRLSEGYKPATLCVLKCTIEDWGMLLPKSCEIVDLMDPLDYNAPARPTRWM